MTALVNASVARKIQEHVSDLLPLAAYNIFAHCDPRVANLDALPGQDAATSWRVVDVVWTDLRVFVPAVPESHRPSTEHIEAQVEWRLMVAKRGVFLLAGLALEPWGQKECVRVYHILIVWADFVHVKRALQIICSYPDKKV